jgi:hypothetical protein
MHFVMTIPQSYLLYQLSKDKSSFLNYTLNVCSHCTHKHFYFFKLVCDSHQSQPDFPRIVKKKMFYAKKSQLLLKANTNKIILQI